MPHDAHGLCDIVEDVLERGHGVSIGARRGAGDKCVAPGLGLGEQLRDCGLDVFGFDPIERNPKVLFKQRVVLWSCVHGKCKNQREDDIFHDDVPDKQTYIVIWRIQ